MKIAIVAPSVWYRIAPPEETKYGGAERIVYWLCEKLVEWGHDVTLFATGDSITSAKLVPTYPCSVLGQDIKNGQDSKISISWNDITDNLIHLQRAMFMAKNQGIKVVHSHVYGDPLVASSAKALGIQVLSTIHNSMSARDMGRANIIPYIFARNSEYQHFVALSKSQILHDDARLPWIDIVYNGLDIVYYEHRINIKKSSNTLLYLSRIDPQKGIEYAIDAARKAGMRLIIAGRIHPGKEEEFFKNRIEPCLQEGVLEYVGEVSDKEKLRLFSEVAALIFPAFWNDVCPVTPLEANACMTPVIAFDCGSLRELIEHNVSGFIVPPLNEYRQPNIQGLVDAIKRIDQIDPKNCFDHVKRKFTADIMVENYLNIYRELGDQKMEL